VIAIMKDDPNVPALFKNLRAMRAYVSQRRAHDDVAAAVPAAWLSYRSWLDRHPFGAED
jgi:hypothetical protein